MNTLKEKGLNVLFPQANCCHICGAFLSEGGILCPNCLKNLRKERLNKPTVQAEGHPPLSVCLSAFEHDGAARQLVHMLKYQADGLAAEVLGEHMALVLAQEWKPQDQPDVVIPVPLHERRQLKRGYNQAQLLANVVCRGCGLLLETEALVRVSSIASQVHRGRSQRLQAMIGSFACPFPQKVQGKRILLVDDVLTTGATAVACAVALLDAGAEEVSVLTACRVSRAVRAVQNNR